MAMNKWIEQLVPIIQEYGEGEALDGDAVDDLCVILRAKMNLDQGNITEDEYEAACDDKDIYKAGDEEIMGKYVDKLKGGELLTVRDATMALMLG